MKSILLKIYTGWVLFVFTFFMILFLPGIVLPAFFGPRAVSVTYFFMKLWSWLFSKLTFIRYQIINREKIEKGKAFIYVSNHTSFLDLPGIAMTIRGQFRPLAKKELLKIPVFGWVTRATCVVVDRDNGRQAVGVVDLAGMECAVGGTAGHDGLGAGDVGGGSEPDGAVEAVAGQSGDGAGAVGGGDGNLGGRGQRERGGNAGSGQCGLHGILSSPGRGGARPGLLREHCGGAGRRVQ